MAAVSVLVTTRNPRSALPALVRSLDSQTLPLPEFEVVVVDASTDGSAVRLQQLAGRRPNVTLVTADPKAGEPERLALALEQASGDHVLVVEQQQRLAPRALELLLRSARRTGADLVLGRVVTAAASGSAVVPDDVDGLDVSALDAAGCIALVRRSLLEGRADAAAALLDVASLAKEAGTVSAVGRYACSIQGGRAPSPGDDGSIESTAHSWGDGMLRLEVGVRLREVPPPTLRTWLVLAQGSAEIALPATTEPDEQEGTRFTASAAFDPRTAAGGQPLDDGPWSLLLRLVWPDHETTLPLGAGPSRSAVLDGRPYVAHTANHALELDAGATRTSVIGPVPTSRASIAESVRGTLVTFDYPSLHVQGDTVLDARLLLGGFGLPARLVCADGRARLEAFASSLAGDSTVSVVAGGGRPVPTGLELRVDGTGRMVFKSVQARTPAPAGAPASVPLAQRVRRRLPSALEPTVQRLARVPALRRTYRRLINR